MLPTRILLLLVYFPRRKAQLEGVFHMRLVRFSSISHGNTGGLFTPFVTTACQHGPLYTVIGAVIATPCVDCS